MAGRAIGLAGVVAALNADIDRMMMAMPSGDGDPKAAVSQVKPMLEPLPERRPHQGAKERARRMKQMQKRENSHDAG